MNARRELEIAMAARIPVVAIASDEEDRVLTAIQEIASEPVTNLGGDIIVESRIVYRWTLTEGIRRLGKLPEDYIYEFSTIQNPDTGENEPNTSDPMQAIQDFIEYSADGNVPVMQERASILVMCDLHRFVNPHEAGGKGDIHVIRALRDLASTLRKSQSCAVLLSPHFSDLGDGKRDIMTIDWPLPSTSELIGLVETAAKKLEGRLDKVDLNGETETMARALAALTWTEATRVLSQAIIETRRLTIEDTAPVIIRQKAEILKAAQGAELEYPDETVRDVGGLEVLKAEVANLPRLLSSEAKELNVDPPRGYLFAGPPGTGKSLTAKVMSGGVMPVLRWDPALSRSKFIGESAANTSGVLKAAEALAPCVLWIDEGDTSLTEGSVESDGGVRGEMVGQVLTWMQERGEDVIMVMTTNHPERLRHAMTERFDRKFLVDYPNLDACHEIIKIHLRKRGIDLVYAVTASLACTAHLRTLSGRAIENAIKSALRKAFLDGKQVTGTYVKEELKLAVSTYSERPDEIDTIRKHCANWERASEDAEAIEPSGTKETTVDMAGVDL